MTILDHLLVLILCFGLPVYAAWSFPRTVRRLESGRRGLRIREYVEIILIQWALVGGLAWMWDDQARAAGSLGLVWPAGWRFWLSLVTVVAGAAFLLYQLHVVTVRDDARRQVRAQLDSTRSVAAIIPRSVAELRWFGAVALSAGIGEEVLYRGFLLWYFDRLVGRWPGATLVIVIFGLAHIYQGVSGTIRTGMAGAVGLGLYLLTGSLLASMALHVAVDLINGQVARVALNNGRETG